MFPLSDGLRKMKDILRNVLAVVLGFVVGSVVNMSIIIIGNMVVPLPEGVDMSDMEKAAENIHLLTPANFAVPFFAHALGTLAGAFVATKLAVSRKFMLAMIIGAFFFLGGAMVVAMLGGPVWFAVLDLVVAYFPMAYLGGKLGTGQRRVTPVAQ